MQNIEQTSWIFLPEMRETPNTFFYARKTFVLDGSPVSARLSITAYTDYTLYVNGEFIGRGPGISNGRVLPYDEYDIKDLLTKGENIIAIKAHNYAVGVHWNPAGPGGLLCRAEIEQKDKTVIIETDESWKVKSADCYGTHSPRMMFSCRFCETFYADKQDKDWVNSSFDDSSWIAPEIIGATPVFPYMQLVKRDIPFLREQFLWAQSARICKQTINGVHAVSIFRPEGATDSAIYWAKTNIYCESKCDVSMLISSDDAFSAFVNGEKVLTQCYDEAFIRSALFHGREEYEQFHAGIGARAEQARIHLNAGINTLTVAIDLGPVGWGFALAFFPEWVTDSTDMQPLKLRLGANDGANDGQFAIYGPEKSTQRKDSLLHIQAQPSKSLSVQYSVSDILSATDYQLLMRCEERTEWRDVDCSAPIHLAYGDCALIDLGIMDVGYPLLEIESDDSAILDICVSNVLSDNLKPCGMGDMRFTDRVYCTSGKLSWEGATRRDGRYLHISCRKGSLNIHKVGLNTVRYPTVEQDAFSCSDELLNRIYTASKHSTALIMQHDYEDCLRREEGLHNWRDVPHAFISSYLAFGDARLFQKMFCDLLYTQDDRGWLSGSGPSDDTNDEISKAMWSVESLLCYIRHTNDLDFARKVYRQMKCFMRYLARMENKRLLIDGRNETANLRGRSVWIDDHTADRYNDYDCMMLSFNLLYYGTLRNMAQISTAIGQARDAVFYNEKADTLKASIHEAFYDKSKQMYVDWVKDDEKAPCIQDAFLILGLYYGAFENEEQVVKHLFDDRLGSMRDPYTYHYTFGYYYFILTVLFRLGMDKFAYSLIRIYFGTWLDLGFTAFGEHFMLDELISKTSLGRDFNVHTDSSAAQPFYYTHILGIKLIKDGYSAVRISPTVGDLEWASGKIITPKGAISVDWRINNGIFSISVTAPKDIEISVKTPFGLKTGDILIAKG